MNYKIINLLDVCDEIKACIKKCLMYSHKQLINKYMNCKDLQKNTNAFRIKGNNYVSLSIYGFEDLIRCRKSYLRNPQGKWEEYYKKYTEIGNY
jgi:hypothetical protein